MFKKIKQFIEDVHTLASDAKVIKTQLEDVKGQIAEFRETVENVTQALPNEVEAKLKLTLETALEPLYTRINMLSVLTKGIR